MSTSDSPGSVSPSDPASGRGRLPPGFLPSDRRPHSHKRFDPKHLAWIREQPCCVPGCERPAQAHHVRSAADSGIALKPADRRCVPLCAEHHHELHLKGHQTFQAAHEVDLDVLAGYYARASGTIMP